MNSEDAIRTERRVEVVVVGAGLSGLYAAALLRARGIECVVLESRDRTGGRALSMPIKELQAGGRFDLGPAWFWPGVQPRMPRLVAELGLVAFPQYSAGDALLERFRTDAAERYPVPVDATLESMRIRGGVAAVTDSLAGSLPSGTIWRGARVTRIRRGASADVSVGLANPGGREPRIIMTRFVILTPPPRVIARTISFEPPLPLDVQRRLVATPTWMAGHAKAVAVYERPFWRDAGLSGTATSFVGPMTEIHDASPEQGPGALVGFVAVPPVTRREMGENRLCADVVAQLGRLFGPRALQPTGILLKDWAMDPDTATADDIGPPSGHPVYREIPASVGPWRDCLSFGGTESAAEHGGYLEGAIAAAERAVATAWLTE